MQRAKRYVDGAGSGRTVTLAGLRRFGAERQAEVMEAWFLASHTRVKGLPGGNPHGAAAHGALPSAFDPVLMASLLPDVRQTFIDEFSTAVRIEAIERAVDRIDRLGPRLWARTSSEQPFGVLPFGEMTLANAGTASTSAGATTFDGGTTTFDGGATTFDDGTVFTDGGRWETDDFTGMIARLEAGLMLRFGDDEETTRRQDLLRRIGELQEALATPGIGHNSAGYAAAISEAQRSTSSLRAALDIPEPNGLEIGRELTRLRRIYEFLKSPLGTIGLGVLGNFATDLVKDTLLPALVSMLSSAWHYLIYIAPVS